MRPAEDKVKYIQLRAEGKSYRAISKEIGVCKDTCQRWEADLKAEIAERKAEQLEELYESYHMTRQARITQLGEAVKKIDSAIDLVGFDEASPERLLDLKLKYLVALVKKQFLIIFKYLAALKDEYLPINTPANNHIQQNGDYMENVLIALNDLLVRVRTGEVTAEQASKESAVISNILKAIEVKDVKHKLEMLESVLGGRNQ